MTSSIILYLNKRIYLHIHITSLRSLMAVSTVLATFAQDSNWQNCGVKRLHAYMRFVQAVIGVLPSVYTFSFWKKYTSILYSPGQSNRNEIVKSDVFPDKIIANYIYIYI